MAFFLTFECGPRARFAVASGWYLGVGRAHTNPKRERQERSMEDFAGASGWCAERSIPTRIAREGDLPKTRGRARRRVYEIPKVATAITIIVAMFAQQLHADNPKDKPAGRLEFRILADTKHDRDAADKAMANDTLKHPPDGYRWVRLGEVMTGSDPKLDADTLTSPGATWKENEFAGRSAHLTGLNLAGSKFSMAFEIVKNSAETLGTGQVLLPGLPLVYYSLQ